MTKGALGTAKVPELDTGYVDVNAPAIEVAVVEIDIDDGPERTNVSELSPPPHPAGRLAIAQMAIKRRDFAAVAGILDVATLPDDAAPDVLLGWAEALAQASATEQSDTVFEMLLARHPRFRRGQFSYAKRLHVRGSAIKAARLLDEIVQHFPEDSPPRTFIDSVRHLRDLLQAREGADISEETDCRLLAMKHAMAAFYDRETPSAPTDQVGRLTLVTGSLGPGGAERQLSRLAAGLELLRQRGEKIGDVAVRRPVEVMVRSHGPEQENDFFLAELREAKVEINQIAAMPMLDQSSLEIADKDLAALIGYLPARVTFDLYRIVDHFRKTKPDVVSIWQDGACLFAGPAAVIAGVPKIQLVLRGLPPIIRKHMFLPEYETTYRALAKAPGVEFISNSHAAAKAYAEWLDLPLERFSVVYNGVAPIPARGSEELDRQWQAFVARTPDADHTVGGVFRFDTDKRPQMWIRFAARYAKKHPNARFVVVGGGRLLNESKELAEQLGVAERILFVGRSSDVGYWMNCMDALVLMSIYEGLPNVLIEAQYLGVPVVSTPAGGSAECFVEGVTGHVLGCAERTNLDEACEKVQALIGRARDPAIFGPATRDFLEPNFSVSGMIENYVHLASGKRARHLS